MGKIIELESLERTLAGCVEVGYINEYASHRIRSLAERNGREGMIPARELWRPLTPGDCPSPQEEAICLGETGDIAILRLILRKGQPMWHPPVKCRITHWMPLPEPPEGFEPNKRI